MSTWDDKPNDYEHALAEIERLRRRLGRDGGCWSTERLMTDIVERLRERTENIDVIFEAADEIERLRDRLTKAQEVIESDTDEIERLRADKSVISATAAFYLHEVERLGGEV